MWTVEHRTAPASATAPSASRTSECVEVDGLRWLTLMEYAAATGVSLSTLRRHIKSGKLEHRLEEGRYLLPFQGALPSENTGDLRADESGASFREIPRIDQELMKEFETVALEATGEIARLEAELKRSREEIAELKTLVALYEEQIFRPNPTSPASGRR